MHPAHQLSNAYELSQVGESLSVFCVSGLVLEEDGTGVDTEGFFQALPENSVLMVLEKDQKWTPDTVRECLALPSLTTRGHCWNYTKYLYKGWSSENRLGLNPALKYVLSRPHADLVSFFFPHQSSLQGSAPVWQSSPLVHPLGTSATKCSRPISSSCLSLLSQKSPSRDQPSDFRLWKRTDVARLTFDLYKNNPEDFIGCLNVKATFYGVYSVSYDLRCYAAKKMLKWVPNPWRFMMILFFVLDPSQNVVTSQRD